MNDKDETAQLHGRETATQALISSLHTKYPEKGFLLNPSLKFCSSQDGACMNVVAQARIQKDETLLVLPDDAQLSTHNVLDKSLRETIETRCATDSTKGGFRPDDVSFAAAIMRVLMKKCTCEGRVLDSSSSDRNMDIFMCQAATWPSEADMKQSSFLYADECKIKQLWNLSGLTFVFLDLRQNLRQVFDRVLFPLLKDSANDYIDPSLPSNKEYHQSHDQQQALWNTFLYAFSLLWSRAHGDTYPNIIPLIELFNGTSERVDQTVKKSLKHQKTKINVSLATGKWPFVKGSMYTDECNLACNSVYAARDIEEGEELIISYGYLRPLSFALKYGTIPKDLLHHHDIINDVEIFCKPSLIPVERMRVMCLEKAGYPLDLLKNNEEPICSLPSTWEDFEAYAKNGREPECIKCIRQLVIISKLATENELQMNHSTGRLRGNFHWKHVLALIIEIIDYNLEKLAPATTTSAKDAKRANLPDVLGWEKGALLARIVVRENLIMWRYAISCQGGYSASVQNALLCMADGGCFVCGRTYPNLRCSGCKEVEYCSRGHQALDWKRHKLQCKKG